MGWVARAALASAGALVGAAAATLGIALAIGKVTRPRGPYGDHVADVAEMVEMGDSFLTSSTPNLHLCGRA